MRGLDLTALASRADADAALTEAVPDQVVRAFLLQNLRRSQRTARLGWQPNLEVIDRRMDAITGWPAEELAGVAPYDGPGAVGARRAVRATSPTSTPSAMAALFPACAG